MGDQVELLAKRNADGSPIPGCWVTADGYTVALCRLPEKRWTITRPGGRAPFLYTGLQGDVRRMIVADRLASAAPA